MPIPTPLLILLVLYALINLCAFSLMLADKKRARQEDRRISEGQLLFAAIALGALGVWAGMYVAHHKTQKLIFILGVPLALVQNLALFYLAYSSLSGRL
jgi:uncharacterized membrane protein YsdA (DUF1294 family)